MIVGENLQKKAHYKFSNIHAHAWAFDDLYQKNAHMVASIHCRPLHYRHNRIQLTKENIILYSFHTLFQATCTYRSVLSKHPWTLKHNSLFWPAWAPARDQNPIHLYRSCYSGPLKYGTWALTQELALAQDTTVYVHALYMY